MRDTSEADAADGEMVGVFGWMGGGKLGVAEEGGKKLCERKRGEVPC